MFYYGDKAPGRIFLLVTGIIYIVVGALGILGGLATIELMQSPWRGMWERLGTTTLNYYFVVYSVVVGLFALYMGILGIKHRNNRDYAAYLFNLGILAIILDVGGNFFFSTLSPTSLFFLGLPICYMVGAHKNK